MVIELRDISVGYGKRQVLSDVSLSLERGKLIGLIGPNGSGKTTLLKLIAGLLKTDSGHAELSGEALTRRAASRIAYMADTDEFFPYYNAKQIFEYYESQFSDFVMEKALEMAAFLEVPLEEKLKSLSKGNKGRVKIAATFGREAEYFLLDEPFSGLDPMVRRQIAKGLIRFTDPERQTIVMSTHEIQEAEPLFDELVVLSHGKIIATETVDGIRDQYNMDATSWLISLFDEKTEGGGF